MAKWTNEQTQAIFVRNSNVIVSAGAGSGKTAVLTERVYQMILEGYGLDEIIVLTFTNAAAFEMRERIRKKLLADPTLASKASLVDTSYIMTFDAFALALVKKYHYLLDLPETISITDESIVKIQKKKELETIFRSYYHSQDERFSRFIQKFVLRDDASIQSLILKMDQAIELRPFYENYIEEYMDTYFSLERVEKDLEEFRTRIQKQIEEATLEADRLPDIDDIEAIHASVDSILKATDYEAFYSAFLGFKMPALKKGMKEELEAQGALVLRNAIRKTLQDTQKDIARIGNKALAISRYMMTKEDVAFVLSLVKELHERMVIFKRKYHIFTFNDIAKYALALLDQDLVIHELKDKVRAVMVDEYQDTSDLQDAFLMKISDHNLYMVGDIKQSIYRFRNANCSLFMEKYLRYAQGDDGIKIDLNKNFRSRKEVIEDINSIFSDIMHLDYGGADYRKDHIILAGNRSYDEEGKNEEDHHLEILYVEGEEDGKEKEIRAIAEDILLKEGAYPIFDKDHLTQHPAEFKDFSILIDRKSSFDLYKKIFEEYQIPIRIEKDENLTASLSVIVLISLLKLYHAIQNENYDDAFKHTFCSVYRSFLWLGKDDELEKIVLDSSYSQTPLFIKMKEVVEQTKGHSLFYQVRKCIDAFDFENALLRIGNVEKNQKQLEQLYSIMMGMEEMEYTMHDFITYLEDIQEMEIQLTSSYQDDGSNSVRLLTIHKSKGLEFPIVYYAGLKNAFNDQDHRGLFLASYRYGILLPCVDEYAPETFYHYMLKSTEAGEELSEKIRLLYVAMTRAKEKMIFVLPKDVTPSSFLFNAKDLYSILMKGELASTSGELRTLCHIRKDRKSKEEEKVDAIHYEPIEIPFVLKEKARASLKEIHEDDASLNYGEELHFLFEMIDFSHPDLSFIQDIKQKHYIEKFLSSPLYLLHRHETVFHEYAYMDQEMEGIIDLLFVGEKEATIIDFKTSSIEDEGYVHQLETYRNYVEKTFHKPTKTYLYSIIKGTYKEV